MTSIKTKVVVGAYALFGALWILFFDKLVSIFFADPDTFFIVNTVKGWAYLLVTSLVLLIVLKRYEETIEKQRSVIQENEITFHALFEGVSDPILLIKNGVFIECNDAALNAFHEKNKDLLINSSPIDHAPEFQENGKSSSIAAKEFIAHAYHHGPTKFEWICERSDASLFTLEATLVPIWIKGEELLYVIAHDITERKKSEEALRMSQEGLEKEVENRTRDLQQLNSQLLSIDKRKSDFLSLASHELRTPLTSVLGFAHLVAKRFQMHFMPLTVGKSDLHKRGMTLLDNLYLIESEGKRLTRLVNDLLDLSKIESGKIEYKQNEVDLAEEMRLSIMTIFNESDQRSQVVFSADSNLQKIAGDRDRIRQVFLNVLSNAAKFSNAGDTRVSLVQKPRELEVRVQDDGPGISEDDLERIFEPFYQSVDRDPNDMSIKGTGLGLAICRQIIELHGGRIRAESDPGNGATFIITFPIEQIS